MEVAPVDKGSDRGRRVRGARGERTNFKRDGRLKIWIFLMYVNVTQDLEVEAEAEHQQGVGSQPREWGINTPTPTHTERKGENMQFIYQLSLSLISFVVTLLVYIEWTVICISDFFPGPSTLLIIHRRLGQGPHKPKAGTRWPTTALTEQVSAHIRSAPTLVHIGVSHVIKG